MTGLIISKNKAAIVTHDELITALTAATGPSYELDQEIARIVGIQKKVVESTYANYLAGEIAGTYYTLPNFTGSLDATVKAIKAKWPEADWRIGAASWAIVTPPDHWSLRGNGNTPELSLCIAFVAALKTQKEPRQPVKARRG